MCGILGGLNLNESQFNNGLDSMRHRGPDSRGSHISNINGTTVYLGMNRLAITGIATGAQPLHSKCGRVVLTFNGEIYNYQEIWQSLGLCDNPRSDGDAIIELYLKEGLEGFKLLRGMFAISLYDVKLEKIFLIRDWFGEKPLYFFNSNSKLIWSSNIQGIAVNLDSKLEYCLDSVADYFRFTYVPTNNTVYKGISSIEPGVCYEFNLKGKLVESRMLKKEILRDKPLKLLQILPDKIKNGLIGETGVGVLLSGGIDSGIVTSFCARFLKRTPLHAFTISSSDKNYDESEDAKEMASFLNITHTVIDFHKEFNADRFVEVVKNFEQPFADSSFVVSWTAFDFIKRNYPEIKVVLTGDGGDEIWGGYNKHRILEIPKGFNKLISSLARKSFQLKTLKYALMQALSFKAFKVLKAYTWHSRYMGILSLGFDHISMTRLYSSYKDRFKDEPENLEEAIVLDHTFSLLNDLNVKTDQASMYNSIEARSPLLDIDLYSANRNNFKSKSQVAKSLINYFPEKYINKKKRGFAFNLQHLLFNDLRKYSDIYLQKNMLKNIYGINANVAEDIVRRFYNGSYFSAHEVYCLLIASIWFNSRNY